MKKHRPSPIGCVIRETARNYVLRTGIAGEVAQLKQLGTDELFRKLLDLGLTPEEIEELDIRQPMLQSIREYAEHDGAARNPEQQALEAARNTIKVMADQIQGIDLEIQMLNLRKKALKRRSGILERLAGSLSSNLEDRKAA